MLSIFKVRERLGDLTRPIFFHDVFAEKYESVSGFPGEKVAEICEKNHSLTLAYIDAIVRHLEVPGFAIQAAESVSSEFLLSVYAHYWIVTQALVGQNQKRKISVPDSDLDFLRYMFDDFLAAEERWNNS